MAIYLLQPQTTFAGSLTSNLISTKFTADSRKKQIKEFTNFWKEDSTYQEIREWVEDKQAQGKIIARSSLKEPDITGTIIVDVPDEEVTKMQEELSKAVILSDKLLDLVRPHRITTSLKEQITKKDLWHLTAIGLHSDHNQGLDATGDGVTVVVLDTGVDENHPELQGKIIESYNLDIREVGPLGKAQRLERSQDLDGHGTHVAGLICGKSVGVAPKAKIINAVLMPRANIGVSSFFSNFTVAMNFLSTRSDIDIINISAGISGAIYTKLMDNYLETLLLIGILPVCAVGNEGRDRTRSPGNCRSAISVGALDQTKKVAAFSSSGIIVFDNHQYNVPTLVAPGEAIYSSVIGGKYEAWNGTSMATPIVSGIAALILEKYPEITVMQLIEELLSRCQPLDVEPSRQGAGAIKMF